MNRIISYVLSACFVFVLFSCQKEYSFENASNVPAAGSLWDSFGVCLPDSVHGTFYNGIQPGSDTAFVEIQVNVTQTGTYSISSDLQDGFYFTDSGFFSTTGINTIKLKPIGVPIIPTTSIFTITFDSSFCSFEVVIKDSTGTGLGGGVDTGDIEPGTWKFTSDDGNFFGSLDTAMMVTDTTIWGTGEEVLLLRGYTPLTDTAFTIILYLPSGTVEPGIYGSQSAPPEKASLFALNYTTGNQFPIYQALPVSTTGSDMKVTITAYDQSTGIITGTFSGLAEDEDGNIVNITDGVFNADFTP